MKLKNLTHYLKLKNTKHLLLYKILYFFLVPFFSLILLEFGTRRLPLDCISWIFKHPVYTLLNFLILLFIFSIFYFLFGKYSISTLLISIITIALGIANYNKLVTRQEIVLPADFEIVNEWGTAFSSVSIIIRPRTFFIIFICLFFLLGGMILDLSTPADIHISLKKRILYCAETILSGFLAFFLCFYPSVKLCYLDNNGLNRQTTNFTHKTYGCLYVFLEYLTIGQKTPDNSSIAKNHRKILQQAKKNVTKKSSGTTNKDSSFQNTNNQKKPNIIAIMSESLWDINDFSKTLEWNQNPMSIFNETKETYGGGKIAVNVYGGSTANTEFEFLTGLNTKYITSGSIAYNDIHDTTPSLASYLNYELGYSSIAIHPFTATFWRRNEVYPLMGFDRFYYQDTMKNKDRFDVYISDESLSREIILKYENHKRMSNSPLFCFAVTMQNHSTKINVDTSNAGNYKKNITYKFKKKQSLSKESKDQLDRYINGVYSSGLALKELMDYFDSVNEPTIIVLFGDHAPPLNSEVYDYCLGYDNNTASTKKEFNSFFETPVVFYNNYNLKKTDISSINSGYLSTALLEYAQLPLTNQAVINKHMQTLLPINTKYIIQNHSRKNISSLNSELSFWDNTSYESFYDLVYGKHIIKDLWKPAK